MKNLRKRFDRFCFRNRDKGIPNLMLYIVLGNALVLIMSMVNGGNILYELLCFDKARILQGQVWRLVSFVFTQSGSGFLELLLLYFFYMLGRHVELSMGTLRFNLFYLTGIVFMDIFAMIFCPAVAPGTMVSAEEYTFLMAVLPTYMDTAYYLHLSLVLAYATMYPDSQFLIFFIIPVKAWVIALVDLLLVLVSVFNLSYPALYFPHNLFPLVALGNYFLFMGGDIKNLIPLSWRRGPRKAKSKTVRGKVVPFPGAQEKGSAQQTPDYNHRCTVCGRTDVTNPELEFRYCSRCQGYHCYCEDHIGNHEHVE